MEVPWYTALVIIGGLLIAYDIVLRIVLRIEYFIWVRKRLKLLNRGWKNER